jgi:hypothetical protein
MRVELRQGMTAYNSTTPVRQTNPSFSIISILAVVCAIASFFFGAGLGLLLAIAAIVLGAIGVIMSLSPRVRGGVISTFSMFAGAIGIIAAIFKIVAKIL